jgi:hypothetical protein
MTDCPLCSGKLLITASKAGEEIYCTKCLSVMKSASLKFSVIMHRTLLVKSMNVAMVAYLGIKVVAKKQNVMFTLLAMNQLKQQLNKRPNSLLTPL